MTTFTIRVASSATNAAGTGYGIQPDVLAPSYWDVYISGSSNPDLMDGVYDGYCLNPTLPIGLSPTSIGGDGGSGSALSSFAPIGLGSLTQVQVDQLNWLLAQNFTSDSKFAGQYNYGEVQVAIWKICGFSDLQIQAGNNGFLTDNGRIVVNFVDADSLVSAAQAAINSGNGVVPSNAFFSMVLDPAGDAQPLIIQLQSGKIGNFVWEDINRDGIQDANESGVNNVVVELYDGAGNFIASTLTGDDFSTAAVERGYYQFAGLKAGDYQVKFIAPTYDFTVQDSSAAGATDANDSDANAASGLSQIITLPVGGSNQTIDAGLVSKAAAAISGFVYCDDNNNGVKEVGEVGLGGVTVTLTGTNDQGVITPISVLTNADGSYSFGDLRPGTYTVTETTQPADKLDGKDTAGNTPGSVAGDEVISNIVLGAGTQSIDNNFGEIKPGSISGFVYCDTNNDGVKDSGELGLGGVTVTLTGTNDQGAITPISVLTNVDGSYSFGDLRPGTYTVTETTQPAGKLDGKDTAGTAPVGGAAGTAGNEVISAIVLPAGGASVNNNFGEIKPAVISGFVYCDDNNNGIQESGEVGLAGVTVTLTGSNDQGAITPISVLTNADGSYSFTGLRPGTYTVTETTQPAGKLDGKETAGSTGGNTTVNEVISGVTVGSGQTSSGNNFGEIKPGSISGFVYCDTNNDGVKDGGEVGLGGVTVTLTGSNDQGAITPISVLTNADGSYSFGDLRPGTYTVTETTQPAGKLDGQDTAGTAPVGARQALQATR